ncbi:hypothetical protein DPMN_150752 [Dreissena polymorpha]|uniref:WAP domain-containing protein n=1 Tax=Dreissena polymorpha TaxID=45954 RepID=A0A9D4FFX3_DREPO|nr:hypothetical protein DPMN_150752 [Dreissena polymorpha]
MNLLLIFCLVCSLIVECSTQKPGACPPGDIGPAVCQWDCENDNECPGEKKCCKYSSCMFLCATPTLTAIGDTYLPRLP